MSLILDALKRAENERSAIMSSINDQGSARAGDSRPNAPRFGLAVVAAVVVIVAAAFAWKYWVDRTRGDAPVAPLANAPAPVPVAEPRSPLPPARPKVIPGTEGVASLDDVAAAEPELEPEPAPVTTTSKAALKSDLRPAPRPAKTEISDDAEDSAQADSEPESPPEDAQPQARPEPPPQQLTRPAKLRRFKEMPPAYRADFPAITIEVHVHDADPKKRWVMINGIRYREGQALNQGPAVREIVAEGVVFEYRGETFIYSLKSWPAGLD